MPSAKMLYQQIKYFRSYKEISFRRGRDIHPPRHSVHSNALKAFFYHFPIQILFPANIYLFKVTNRNTRKRCEMCSKLTVKASMTKRQWLRSGVFIVNFDYISHFFLVFLLLTLNKWLLARFCLDLWLIYWIDLIYHCFFIYK